MSAEGQLHSMAPAERALARDVLTAAWARLAAAGAASDQGRPALVGLVRAVAGELPAQCPAVSPAYAHHLGEAAVWYLDRAVRRVADPERDGHTAGRRAANLGWFGATASPPELERLFAVAVALNSDDE